MADRINWFDFVSSIGGFGSESYNELISEFSKTPVLRYDGLPMLDEFKMAHEQGRFDNLLSRLEDMDSAAASSSGVRSAVTLGGKELDFQSFLGPGYDVLTGFKAAEFKVESIQDVAFLHFSRNALLDESMTYERLLLSGQYQKISDVKNAFHVINHGAEVGNENNFKWVSLNDSEEYIFTPTDSGFVLETDPINQGSYNFAGLDETRSGFGIDANLHNTLDVRPWVLFGNAFGDPTSMSDRSFINSIGYVVDEATDFGWGSVYRQAGFFGDAVYEGSSIQRTNLKTFGGDDTFISGPQEDSWSAGDGFDTISFEKSTSAVAVNLEKGQGYNGYAARSNNLEVFSDVEGLIGSRFSDILIGSGVNNSVFGGDGSDILIGKNGDDFLDGGSGQDIAVFLGNSGSYNVFSGAGGTYYVERKQISSFSIDDMRLYTEGRDTLVDIEKVRFRDGTFNISDLVAKAPVGEESEELVDGSGSKIGTVTIGAPTHDQGSEIEFSLNLSTSGVGTQYRVALIIDVSGSMGGSRISEAKAAYVDLINYLKDQGIADVTEFAVIPFQSSATLYEGLSADEAIARINSLSAGGGTSFGPAISRGLEFFDGTSAGLTQIAYFLSDGQGSGASTALQAVADVRAFGIGSGASISSLNTIDSNNAVILNSASDLAASFTESEIKTADVDRIEVYLNGTLAQTITGDQLTDNGATGLTFSGTINGLDTSNADTLEAKVFFQDTSIPAQSVAFEIGDGVTEAAGTDGDDNIAFSLSQKTVDAGGGNDTVLANDLDNTVIKISGNGVIKTFGGNDMVHAGDNRLSGLDRVIDGGDGTDTVVYVGNYSEYTVSQTGGLIKVGTATDSLSNVEFLQFDDVKVRTSDLSVVQTLSAGAAEVKEGDSGTQQITFTVTLDAASAIDVTFDYATANGTAEAGSDFTTASGSLTLLAGETQKTVTVDIIGDAVFEGDETFELQLSNANGAVFDGGGDTYSITGTIKNDDDANQVETGSAGDDVINTGKGNDQINSGAGNDVVNANLGNDVVVDGLGNNNLNGDGGADAVVALSGINTATGGDGSDYLAGGFQSDNLSGGAGNDVLRGDAGGFLGGSDILTGGTDNDFLMGGRGADTFVFNTNDGSDIIAAFDVADMGFGPLSGYTATATGADFHTGVDHIQLAGFSTVDASNVMSSVTDGADGAVFSAEGTDITFYGVATNQLTADDFIFV